MLFIAGVAAMLLVMVHFAGVKWAREGRFEKALNDA